MLHLNSGKRFLAAASLLLVFACAIQRVTQAATTTVYTDNTSKTTAGTESVSGTRRLTSSFTTGTTSTYLQSITLLLANPTSGQATLSVYTDSLLKPGTLVGTLTSPASFTSGTSETTFTASGIPLAASTTYWVVLRANSGTFNWAWTNDNTGTGTGYTHTWGESDDAGSTWQTYNVYPLQMRVTASDSDTAVSTVQFNASILQVGEGDDDAIITVTRFGDSSSAATVDYATSDTAGSAACSNVTGTVASSRCDYLSSNGTLQFAAGETSKTITIPIIDDGFADGNEIFSVTLSNPTNVGLGTPTAATVTITDNDSSASTTNPIDEAAFFIRQQYLDFLRRDPDSAGLQFYLDILNGCQSTDTECVKYTRGAISANFFRSPEFQQKGAFVMYLYMVSLGQRPSTDAELADPTKNTFERPHYGEFIADLQSISDPNDDKDIVSAKKDALTVAWLQRSEIQQIYGSLTNAQFVQNLADTSGVAFTSGYKNGLVTKLNNGTMTRAQVLRAIVESTGVNAKFYKQAFVTMEYFGYLMRDPDLEGYVFHNNRFQLTADPDFLENTIVRGFIESPEYRQRFGP